MFENVAERAMQGLMENVLARFNLTQEGAQELLVKFVTELQTWQNERIGFKAGAQQAMQHFDARLARIEQTQAQILALLQPEKTDNDAETPRVRLVSVAGGPAGGTGA